MRNVFRPTSFLVLGAILAGSASAADSSDPGVRAPRAEPPAQIDVLPGIVPPGDADTDGETPRALPGPPVRTPDTPVPRAHTQECAWTGQRTVLVLMRDDLIAAEGFYRFYTAFECPVGHLADTLGCALDVEDDNDTAASTIEHRVRTCWSDPNSVFEPASPAEPDADAPPPEGEEPRTAPATP